MTPYQVITMKVKPQDGSEHRAEVAGPADGAAVEESQVDQQRDQGPDFLRGPSPKIFPRRRRPRGHQGPCRKGAAARRSATCGKSMRPGRCRPPVRGRRDSGRRIAQRGDVSQAEGEHGGPIAGNDRQHVDGQPEVAPQHRRKGRMSWETPAHSTRPPAQHHRAAAARATVVGTLDFTARRRARATATAVQNTSPTGPRPGPRTRWSRTCGHRRPAGDVGPQRQAGQYQGLGGRQEKQLPAGTAAAARRAGKSSA